jgi:cell division protein FtsL
MSWFSGLDLGVNLILALTLLVMLYAIALLNRAVRLLQYQVEALEKDIGIISEEIKLLSSGEKAAVDLSDWAKEEGLGQGR